jgi:Xaa-Pro aminopeptidase
MPATSRPAARFYYAAPERDGDLLYFGGFSAPDPFFAWEYRGKRYALLSSLEIGRARRESRFDHLLSLEEERKAALSGRRSNRSQRARLLLHLSRKIGFRHLVLSPTFPASLILELKGSGLSFEPGSEPFEPGRVVKSPVEIRAIRAANRVSAAGMKLVEKVLRDSRIEGRRLLHEGKVLTSERLQEWIEMECLRRGYLGNRPIVAGGNQGCDPHEHGHGPLRPHELIVVDIFPRHQRGGYHGDMTRTFLRGRASEAQKQLVSTVREAQERAIDKVKAGVKAATIHLEAAAHFEEAGYPTGERNGVWEGFFHGTGHGLGLDVHEAPRVGMGEDVLRRGMVITIEPGLYYPGLGGCRIEDVVEVTGSGSNLLSKAPYRWHLR